MKSISIKIKKLRQSFQFQSKIFVSLFSFILIFNSLALPALAADSSAAGSPELIDFSKLTEDELLSIGTDAGDLPFDSVVPTSYIIPAASYDGTSFFDDLDDSDASFVNDITISDPYTDHSWRPWARGGFIEIRYYYIARNGEVAYLRDLMEVDFDSPLEISLRKNTNPSRGQLEHSIRFTQFVDGQVITRFGWFPDFGIDDYQGFYLTLGDGQFPTAGVNGSLCQPSWNVSYVKNTVTYPGYFAEFPQVYGNFVLSATQVESAGNGGYISFWAIPTYAGQYSIREYETNNIILTHNNYGQILDSYMMYVVGFNSGNIRFYITRHDGYISYNNLSPNPQRYAVSEFLNKGPLYPFSLKSEINGKVSKSGSFPKYYLDSTSDISLYIASEQQYNAYQESDQKIEDDIQIQKDNYDKKSEEFKESIKGFEALPKPDITSNTVILPSGSVESIDELSGILSIIWEDKMVKEMLIISLTFVFVGYILFGKRG